MPRLICGGLKFRIGRSRLLERVQPLFKELLVHVRDAQVVEARGVGGIRLG